MRGLRHGSIEAGIEGLGVAEEKFVALIHALGRKMRNAFFVHISPYIGARRLRKEGVRENAWSISRFKGLGEMNAEQLWDTTLNPDTRRLLPVFLGTTDFGQTELLITKLMGKGEAAARRELMELHGDAVEVDI